MMKNWKQYLPDIGISVALPFCKIRTSCLLYRYDQDVVEWISLEVSVWKWHTQFRLYSRSQW